MPHITALCASLLVALYLLLTFRVIGERFRSQVGIGTGGDARLVRVVRVHGNFAEYVPVFLAALLAAELCGAPSAALHGAAVAMLAGRVLHAAGMWRAPDIRPLRAAGMLLTLAGLVVVAALALAGGMGLW